MNFQSTGSAADYVGPPGKPDPNTMHHFIEASTGQERTFIHLGPGSTGAHCRSEQAAHPTRPPSGLDLHAQPPLSHEIQVANEVEQVTEPGGTGPSAGIAPIRPAPLAGRLSTERSRTVSRLHRLKQHLAAHFHRHQRLAAWTAEGAWDVAAGPVVTDHRDARPTLGPVRRNVRVPARQQVDDVTGFHAGQHGGVLRAAKADYVG
jgi:hypothetical protein